MACKDSLDKQPGIFQIYGPDIILDEDLNVYLLEINQTVYLMGSTQGHREVIPVVVKSWLDMVLYVQRRKELGKQIFKKDLMKFCFGCSLLINDDSGYNYLEDDYNNVDDIQLNLKKIKVN